MFFYKADDKFVGLYNPQMCAELAIKSGANVTTYYAPAPATQQTENCNQHVALLYDPANFSKRIVNFFNKVLR